jgi:hypothetical protein
MSERILTFEGLGVTTDANFYGNPNEVIHPETKVEMVSRVLPSEKKHQTPPQVRENWQSPYEG